MQHRKMIYICSPCRGDFEKNIIKAQEYCRAAADAGLLPVAPHVYITQFYSDIVPHERKAGMDMGRQLLSLCSEVWVFGIEHPSAGMAAEIELAILLGIPVKDGFREIAEVQDPEPEPVGLTFKIAISEAEKKEPKARRMRKW